MAFDRLKRREFFTLISSAAAAWSLAAPRAATALPVIGSTPEDSAPLVVAFRRGDFVRALHGKR